MRVPGDGDRRPPYRGDPERLLGVVVACGERHLRAFRFIVEHGVFDAAQMAVLLGVSRPTALRVLTDLVRVGAVYGSFASARGRKRRYYVLSGAGRAAVIAGQRRRGRAAPPIMNDVACREQHAVNQVFVDLVGYGRRSGRGELYRWRHRLDAGRLLHRRGLGGGWCDGSGLWIDDEGIIVDFAVHWGAVSLSEIVDAMPAAGDAAASAVGAVLVVCPHAAAERRLHAELAAYPAGAGQAGRVTVASSTAQRMRADIDGAAGAVWARHAGAVDGIRVRLVALGTDAAAS